jgi:hypothetical protein
VSAFADNSSKRPKSATTEKGLRSSGFLDALKEAYGSSNQRPVTATTALFLVIFSD